MAKISGIKRYESNRGPRFMVHTKIGGVVVKKQGFHSQADARAWLNARRMAEGSGSVSRGGIDFSALAAEFARLHIPTLKPRTQDIYSADIRLYLIPALGAKKLRTITPHDFEKLRTTWLAKPLMPKTVNNIIGTAKTIFTKAVDWGYLDNNPVRLKLLRVVRSSDENWWKAESFVHAFMDALGAQRFPDLLRAALILPLEVGPRSGEVCALDVGDIDFTDCTISINKTYNQISRKQEPCKNYAIRILQFTPGSRLDVWLREAAKGKGRSDPLFCGMDGKRIDQIEMLLAFRNRAAPLDLPVITYHGLRHTFATWYLKRGGDIYQLFKLLGHRDISTTMRIYYHHDSKVRNSISWDDGKKKPLTLIK